MIVMMYLNPWLYLQHGNIDFNTIIVVGVEMVWLLTMHAEEASTSNQWHTIIMELRM